jgi:hypothetical protein
MTLGIKVGPQKQSFLDLEATNPPFAEVWFNIGQKDQVYPELFSELHRRTMQVGLHFWGQLPDGTWTNICHTDKNLVAESMALMKETIDIAAQQSFQYVNIHPSNRAKCRIDFDGHTVTPYTDPISEEISEAIFIEHAITLHEYAKNRGVVFTIETAPTKESDDWMDNKARNTPHDIYTLGTHVLIKLADMGVAIANDFGHTSCCIDSNDRNTIAGYLTQTTMTLAPKTRLLHLGYIVPPYSGTDFHDQLDNPAFDTMDAVPNKNEMKSLLQLFKQRNDVWVLVEPNTNHPKNYNLAKKLIDNTFLF